MQTPNPDLRRNADIRLNVFYGRMIIIYCCSRELQSKFVTDRNWHQYHSPRNILLAMVGEVGELSELFQWKGEVGEGVPEFSEKEKTNLRHELSDVIIYLIRLAQVCHVDLPEAILEKFAHNAKKYPADKVYGSSKKYTEYRQEETAKK